MRGRQGWWVGAVAVLLAACGGGGQEASSPTSGSAASPSVVTSSSGAAGSSSSSAASESSASNPIVERCGLPDAPATPLIFPGPSGSSLIGAQTGSGDRVALLLHQTNGDGLCGFWPFMAAAAKEGVRLVAFDLCGYGGSQCAPGSEAARDPVAQVRAVVDRLRQEGARSVTLVGASMGGTIAVGSAAEVKADRVVDLSGPTSWNGVPDTAKALRELRIPVLVVASPGDTDTDPAALQRAVAASPSRQKAYVQGPVGMHGVTLLKDIAPEDPVTPIGKQVLAFVKDGSLPRG